MDVSYLPGRIASLWLPGRVTSLTHWSLAVLVLLTLGLHTKGAVYILSGPKHQRIRAGMAVTLRCTATVDTLLQGAPVIRWYRDETTLITTGGRYVTATSAGLPDGRQDSVENTLTIRNASTVDTAMYTCRAVLGADDNEATAQLIVEDVPDPPVDVKLTSCSNRVAQLSWQLIAENYSPVVQFIIQYNTSFTPGHWTIAKTMLPRTRLYQRITLSPYANYSFRVIAQNEIGQSRPSVPTKKQCRMEPDVPHHNPKGVCTLNVRPKTLVITWQRVPREEQNAPGFYYLVRWRRHDLDAMEDFAEQTMDADENSLTLPDQPIYKEYEIYVLSVNNMGEAVSPPRMVIGYSGEDTPIEVPQSFRLHPEKEVTATTADFVWDAVNSGPWRMQGFFRGYKIQFWKTSEGPSSMREHSIIFREPGPCWRANHRQRRDTSSGHVYNLWPYTNITAQIRALNAKYNGPPSTRLHFRTREGVPEAVTNFHVKGRGPSYLMLEWKPPIVTNGVLTGYHLEYTVVSPFPDSLYPVKEMELQNPADTRVYLAGLIPDELYRVSVYAHTSVGHGDVYRIEERTLPGGPPVAPNFTTVNISKRAVNITWFPSIPGNPGTVFTVEYRVRNELLWQKSDEIRARSWLVLEGLSPDKLYEVRVIARNGDDRASPQTSSPVQSVQIGRRRELSEPTFMIHHIDDASFAVGLLNFSPESSVFYVQWRPEGDFYWRSTDDTPIAKYVTVADLEVGTPYEVRVITKSAHGDAPSAVQTAHLGDTSIGSDPQASRSKSHSSAVFLGRPATFWLPLAAATVAILTAQLTSHPLPLTSNPLQLTTQRSFTHTAVL